MRASLAVPPVPGALSAGYPAPGCPAPPVPGASVPGPVGRPGLDPLIHGPDAIRELHPGAPAEVTLCPLDRDGAALQFAGPHRSELRIGTVASDVADHGGQLEHADLGAGADVPGSRAAV